MEGEARRGGRAGGKGSYKQEDKFRCPDRDMS